MKKKNCSNLDYMNLGLASRHVLDDQIDKIIPVGDPKNSVFKAMVNEGICGIAALANLGNSTTEWNQHMKEILDAIPVLVRIENPLVIIGESGTGKESMAKVLHSIANGVARPFKSVNCSAIPAEILESELFGHVKGAFTDAKQDRVGMIESAKKGSIFLDELGKMEKTLQYKLLRVIEEHKVRKIGSNTDIKIDDVKFIISLQPIDIGEKTITNDLLNRLNIYNAIKLPPLKERLKAEPNIVHDVLKELQKKIDLLSVDQKKEIEVLTKKVKEASEKYEKNLKKTDITLSDGTVLPEQRMGTTKNIKHWKEYTKYEAELSRLQSPVRLSPEAEVAIVTHDGYDNKNFRELENILRKALLNTYISGRKEILLQDLPEEVRNPEAKIILKTKTEETQASVFDETINVPLKEIINYADEIKKCIVRNKILSVQNIRNTLRSEGALEKETDYLKFYKKFRRILGKEFKKDMSVS